MSDQYANIARLVRLGIRGAEGHGHPRHNRAHGAARALTASPAKETFATRNLGLAQDLGDLDGEINRLNPRDPQSRGRRRRRPRGPRMGDVHDPRRTLPKARHEQHHRHRRANGARRDRPIRRAPGRTAARTESKPPVSTCLRAGRPQQAASAHTLSALPDPERCRLPGRSRRPKLLG